MRTKSLTITAIFLALAVISTGGFLILQNKKTDLEQEPTKQTINNKQFQQAFKNIQPLPKNLTTALAANLAEGILDNPEQFESEQKLDEIIAESINKTDANACALQEITNTAIKISHDNSEKAIGEYIAKIYSILENNTPSEQSVQSEVEIIKQAIEQEDLVQLEKYQKMYQATIQDLKNIQVPSSWAEVHKEQISIFMLINNIYQSTKDMKNDPLQTTICLSQYDTVPGLINNFAENLFTLAEKQKESFSQ